MTEQNVDVRLPAPMSRWPFETCVAWRKSVKTRLKQQEMTVRDLQASHNELQEDLELWRRCCGLHTIEKWVLNYRKHPAGWAVLLMVHGIPEVTDRLRSKVENYSIYSALFLSFSIPTMMQPPELLWHCDDWHCTLSQYAFFSTLAFAVAAHMLSILLGMSFVNALNEAPRDADVYRMFARGEGYMATVKCQWSFRCGMLANFTSMVVAAQLYVGWVSSFLYFAALLVGTHMVFTPTANRLYATASIVNYWRAELGGSPDADDPFELVEACELFKIRCQIGREMISRGQGVSSNVKFASGKSPGDEHLSDHGVQNKKQFVAGGLL